jgi:hypothetical protein
MLEHRRMLRRVLPLAVALSLGAIPFGAGGCNRGGSPGPAFPQPIRDEKEPGESFDTVSAVPDSGSSGVEEISSSSTEVEIDEGSSAGDDDDDKGEGEGDKDAEKSADTDKSADDNGADGDDGDEDETGDDGEIEVEP